MLADTTGRRVLATTGAAICLCLIAAACWGRPAAGGGANLASSHDAASAARLHITPGDGSKSAEPGGGIRVSVVDGTIIGVTVHTAGDPVTGRLNASGTAWQSSWALNTATYYTVSATAVDGTGNRVTATSSFRTLTPSQTFSTMIFEGRDQTYGVGMPIILSFSRPITDKRAVEHSLELHTSKPVVGAWYWDGAKTLYFRSRRYWRPNTKVRFVGHLDGVQGAPGVYGTHTLTQTFDIGRSLIAVASTLTHRIQIHLGHRLFADWPISAGRPGDATPNGTYLTIEKQNPVDMKGPGYNIEVPWSVRFTFSGDYLHDAYWSVGEQGFTNVSHGCVNLSPAHAETYYKLAVPGDPMTITGSPRGGAWDNGWTIWFLSWRQLVAGSALHEAVQAGPSGSSFVSAATLPPSKAKPPLGAPSPGNSRPA